MTVMTVNFVFESAVVLVLFCFVRVSGSRIFDKNLFRFCFIIDYPTASVINRVIEACH